jgi:hypothetical protein
MVMLFSMLDGAREIPCAISVSAMDDLEHVPRTAPDQREQQFLRLRDRIEQCASRKFLAREFEGNPAGGTPKKSNFPEWLVAPGIVANPFGPLAGAVIIRW